MRTSSLTKSSCTYMIMSVLPSLASLSLVEPAAMSPPWALAVDAQHQNVQLLAIQALGRIDELIDGDGTALGTDGVHDDADGSGKDQSNHQHGTQQDLPPGNLALAFAAPSLSAVVTAAFFAAARALGRLAACCAGTSTRSCIGRSPRAACTAASTRTGSLRRRSSAGCSRRAGSLSGSPAGRRPVRYVLPGRMPPGGWYGLSSGKEHWKKAHG